MAGEALKGSNFDARSRLSNNPESAKSRAEIARGTSFDVSGYSDKEISMAFRGGEFGEKDYARLTGKDLGGDNKKPSSGGGGKDSSGSPGSTPGSSPAPGTSPSPERPVNIMPLPGSGGNLGPGSQSQNISQDNDITTTITGNNNEVSNFQDNSIRQSMGSSDYGTRYARGLKDQYVLNLLNR